MLELIVNIAFPIALILLALVTGTVLEGRHFRSIQKREAKFNHIPTLTGKEIPVDQKIEESKMVTGSVVVSIDHFKRFLASLRNIFGGEVRSYCSLLDRGRREAILRLKEECPDSNLIVNLRVETSSIALGRRNALGCTEVLAYGTALKFSDS